MKLIIKIIHRISKNVTELITIYLAVKNKLPRKHSMKLPSNLSLFFSKNSSAQYVT